MILATNRLDRLYGKTGNTPEVFHIARKKYRTVGERRSRYARVSQLHIYSAPKYSSRFRNPRFQISRKERSQKILDFTHFVSGSVPSAPQFCDNNGRQNDGVVAMHYRRKFFKRSLLPADIVDDRIGIEYVRTGHRGSPAKSLDSIAPLFSKFSILANHFFDAPAPKTDDALSGSNARFSVENKRCGVVVLRLAHGCNRSIRADKAKMNCRNSWCNINNTEIPRLWAERWKK